MDKRGSMGLARWLTVRKFLLGFSNHLRPQRTRIRIENRVGVGWEDEPRAQFHFLP